MKLDANLLRYLSKDEWRVLTAVEMGMKNHELVPAQLVESIAALRRGGCFKTLQNLLKHKLVAHEGGRNDGYKLTYLGYDFLALRTFVARGHISGVGMRIGVGKESDIHVCCDEDGKSYALKLHRLGRVSFRTVKTNRDYMQHRQHASWQYLSRLAARKEFAYLQALYQNGFPVPVPVDCNRHAVLMEFVTAKPMLHCHHFCRDPVAMGEKMVRLILRFAEAGLIHGDFNEFNLMMNLDTEDLVVIDFPQVVSMEHPNAEMYFERDVACVKDYLLRKFAIEFETSLTFAKAFEAYRRNCPEEKAPEGGYDMPAKPKKVEVSLGTKDDAALMGAIESSMKEDANEEEDDEEDEEEAKEESAKFSPPRRTAGAESQFVTVQGVEEGDGAEAGDATASAEETTVPASASTEEEEGDSESGSEDADAAPEGAKPKRVELQHVLRVKRRQRGEDAVKKAAQQERQKAHKNTNSGKQRSKGMRKAKAEIKDFMD